MRRLKLLACLGVLFLTPARAQNIHIVSSTGNVAVTRGEGAAATPRSLQSTLVTDDRIVTGEKSAAEVQVDAVHSLQVGAATEVRLGEVYPGHYQMILGKGGVTWRVADASPAVAAVETPSVSVQPREPGVYTIAINAKGETEIVAKEGNVEVFADPGSQWVTAGQKMLARGPRSNPEFQIVGVSRWKRLLSIISKMQIGGVVSSFNAGDESSRRADIKHQTTANPVHNGSGLVSPPEAHHPPAAAASNHEHAAAAQHSAPASASAPAAAAHSAPASSPSPAASTHK
jgi:hypothetical protein